MPKSRPPSLSNATKPKRVSPHDQLHDRHGRHSRLRCGRLYGMAQKRPVTDRVSMTSRNRSSTIHRIGTHRQLTLCQNNAVSPICLFDIARGSSFECAAIQDVLLGTRAMDDSTSRDLKSKLKWIVSMLTRMAVKFDGVKEPSVNSAVAIDYEHEHRDAEHEHDRKQEPGRAPEDGLRGLTSGKLTVRPR